MHVWLVTVGEPLPLDGETVRLYRTGLLARRLLQNGHAVTWWTSSFDHAAKRSRSEQPRDCRLSDGLRIIQLPGPGYAGNVSLARIRHHRQEGTEFARLARREDQPDVIVASYPTIDLCAQAVRYAAARGVPVALDIRDLWPDIFLDVLPGAFRPLGRAALLPLFRRKRFAFRNATAVLGTSESFVDWGVAAAGRLRRQFDRPFFHGYPRGAFDAEQRAAALEFWRRHFGGEIPENIVCFLGNFSNHIVDFETVVKAAGQFQAEGADVAFVLCGSGPSLVGVKQLAADLPRVTFPGRIDAPEIRALMEHSLAGLVPYAPRWDFRLSLPNKAIEYLSAGLPVIGSLKGDLEEVLTSHGCGLVYRHGDVDSLTAAIRTVLDDRVQLRSLRDNAAAVFESRFSAERVYSEYAAHLETMVATNSPSVAASRNSVLATPRRAPW